MTLEGRDNWNCFIAGGRFKWEKEKELWSQTCILFSISHLCHLIQVWISLGLFSYLYSGSTSHLSEFLRLVEVICLTHRRYSTDLSFLLNPKNLSHLWLLFLSHPTSGPLTHSVHSPLEIYIQNPAMSHHLPRHLLRPSQLPLCQGFFQRHLHNFCSCPPAAHSQDNNLNDTFKIKWDLVISLSKPSLWLFISLKIKS